MKFKMMVDMSNNPSVVPYDIPKGSKICSLEGERVFWVEVETKDEYSENNV